MMNSLEKEYSERGFETKKGSAFHRKAVAHHGRGTRDRRSIGGAGGIRGS